MFYEIFKFEILYRARRFDTYLYFVILLFCSIGAADFIFQGTTKSIDLDAPYSIAFTMAVTSAVFLIIASMIMGLSILRDFDHRMESLMFVNPVTKRDYLLGRFLGSFAVLVFVFSGLLFGTMLGSSMPWRDSEDALPFNYWHYVQPFIMIVLPNLFFAGSLFFVTGALSRKLIVVYTQGVVLLVVYILVSVAASKSDNADLPALFDPFAINTVNHVVANWPIGDRNSLMIPVDGILLNRLLWTAMGVVALAVGYFGFSFDVVRDRLRSKEKQPEFGADPIPRFTIPPVTLNFDFKSRLFQLIHQSFFYFTSLLKEISFWAITVCAAAIMLVNGINLGTTHGVDSYPTTYLIIEELQETSVPFFLLILVFYSGELLWRERDVRMSLVCDALPTSDLANLASRFIGIVLAYVVLLLTLCGSGIIMQTLNGYYQYDLGAYAIGFLLESLSFLVLYTFVAFVFQVVINHKFMAHLATLLFVILTLFFEAMGYDHDVFRFGGDTLGIYSEMNGYGHFLKPFLWIKLYWLAFGLLIFVAIVPFFARGTNVTFRSRFGLWRNHNRLTLILASVAASIFIASGSYIFYNTNILNVYHSTEDKEIMRFNYEKNLKRYENIQQPKIVDVKLKLDLYPLQRDYLVNGQYTLVNKDSVPIGEIHIQKVLNDHVSLSNVSFDRKEVMTIGLQQYGYFIYTLETPLQPGDSVKMKFEQSFVTNGFVEGESTKEVVYNGTFLTNSSFPSLGYNRYFEIRDEDTREKYNLPARRNREKIDDAGELTNGGSGGDGYEISFEIIVSTDSSQTAIAPGDLTNQWTQNDRRYFHYRMKEPMVNFYSIVSAKYAVVRDRWVPRDSTKERPVDLEIYYHQNHSFNLDRMMRSMQASFDYYTKNFGPYAYSQLRIMEYPRYRGFAQSLPGTVPFSESIGFVMDIDDNDVDMAFYVTAHELAHQWWGLQVVAANVEGRDMILESLAQYSALMVMKATYGEEKVTQFLDRQMKDYLRGRALETEGEKPLALADGDSYIHYNKGALAFYSLQKTITEEKVNLALRQFIRDWNAFGGNLQEDRYSTTKDLLGYIRSVTPDSLQYVVTDLFETVNSHLVTK